MPAGRRAAGAGRRFPDCHSRSRPPTISSRHVRSWLVPVPPIGRWRRRSALDTSTYDGFGVELRDVASTEAIIVDAGGRDLRVSNPDRVIFPMTERSDAVTKLDIVDYYLAVGDGIMRALQQRPTTLERWPKGVHPGIVLSTRDRGGGDAFFQKRIPRGAPDYVQTARIQFPSGRDADEVCPTEVAVVGWAAQMGTITFHPWPVRRDDVDHPDELRIDLDPQPGTDFADAVRVAAEARALLDELGYTGFPKTSGGRGVHIYVRIATRWTFTDVRHAAIAFGRELERRIPDQVTTKWWKEERGAAHLRRLQPERARSHHRFGVQHSTEARRPGFGAAGLGRAPPGRSRGLHRRDDARSLRPGGRSPRGDRRHPPLAGAAAEHVRPPRAQGDMPYPPDYPKMPGEPKRVQPSRDRDRPRP